MKQLLAVNIGTDTLWGTSGVGNTYPNISVLISIILKNSLTIAGIIFLALLIFGGLKYIISAGSGDSKQADAARANITNAVIGFLVVFAAYFIIQIIEVITGLEILNPTL